MLRKAKENLAVQKRWKLTVAASGVGLYGSDRLLRLSKVQGMLQLVTIAVTSCSFSSKGK